MLEKLKLPLFASFCTLCFVGFPCATVNAAEGDRFLDKCRYVYGVQGCGAAIFYVNYCLTKEYSSTKDVLMKEVSSNFAKASIRYDQLNSITVGRIFEGLMRVDDCKRDVGVMTKYLDSIQFL